MRALNPDARVALTLREELPERLHTVPLAVYLVFNEGCAASSGSTTCSRALELTRQGPLQRFLERRLRELPHQ